MNYIRKIVLYLFVSTTMLIFGYEAVKFARDQVRITNGETLSRVIQYYTITEHRIPPSGERENVSQFLFDRKLTDKMMRDPVFTSATVMGFKGTGDVVPLTHGFTIPTDSWQHVVITRTPVTHTVTVYLNSIEGSTAVWNEAFSPDAVGTSYNGGERKYFDGRIANLALWTRALTEREIQSIYIQGFTFSLTADLLTGLQHYWKLNNLTDSTAQNNDLTDNNGGANGTGI